MNILGEFDIDHNDGSILIIEDLKGDLVDKKGRLVNKFGYLVDK